MANKMTQIKFTIESDLVSEFKARCAREGVSMTSVVHRFMEGWKPTGLGAIKAHTRPLRRKAVALIIEILKNILLKEEEYRDAIPEQFEQRVEAAETACEYLADAIECLEEAFP